MKIKGKNISGLLLTVVAVIVLIPLCWLAATRLEGTPPEIRIDLPASAVGRSQALALTVADTQSGLRRVWVALLKDGKEIPLFEKGYPAGGITFRGKVLQDTVSIPFDIEKLGRVLIGAFQHIWQI